MSSVYTVNFSDVHKNADLYVPFKLQDTDLTGGSLAMSLRNRRGVVEMTLTIGDGFEIVNALTGDFALHLLRADLAPLDTGVYQHDLLYTGAGGEITRIWRGTFTVSDGVTHV